MSASTSSSERQSRLRDGASGTALPGRRFRDGASGTGGALPAQSSPSRPGAAGAGRANGPEWARQGPEGDVRSAAGALCAGLGPEPRSCRKKPRPGSPSDGPGRGVSPPCTCPFLSTPRVVSSPASQPGRGFALETSVL